jgi:hypothetical protein
LGRVVLSVALSKHCSFALNLVLESCSGCFGAFTCAGFGPWVLHLILRRGCRSPKLMLVWLKPRPPSSTFRIAPGMVLVVAYLLARPIYLLPPPKLRNFVQNSTSLEPINLLDMTHCCGSAWSHRTTRDAPLPAALLTAHAPTGFFKDEMHTRVRDRPGEGFVPLVFIANHPFVMSD